MHDHTGAIAKIRGRPGWFYPFNITYHINGVPRYKALDTSDPKGNAPAGEFSVYDLNDNELLRSEKVSSIFGKPIYELYSIADRSRSLHFTVDAWAFTVTGDGWQADIPYRRCRIKAELSGSIVKIGFGLRATVAKGTPDIFTSLSEQELCGILFFLSCQRAANSTS